MEANRVHVAHLGVDTDHYLPQRGERDRFVLYPARGWPHKNHARLVEAMHLVRREQAPDMRLVLTGGGLDDLGELPQWVDKRGLVNQEELRELYGRAACLAFPSRYEGFGLPPLEAMASGCPVAAARAGSLPEICGDAAEMFDPDDAGDIARAVLAAVAVGPRRVDAGLEQCARFTWKACAEAHVRVYRDVARAEPGADLTTDELAGFTYDRTHEDESPDGPEPRQRAQPESYDVRGDVVGDGVGASEHVACEGQTRERDHHRDDVDHEERHATACDAHRLAVTERPGTAAAVADDHADEVGDHEGDQRLVVHGAGPVDVPVDEAVEDQERHQRRQTADRKELRALRDEALPAVTHGYVA